MDYCLVMLTNTLSIRYLVSDHPDRHTALFNRTLTLTKPLDNNTQAVAQGIDDGFDEPLVEANA